MPIEHGLEKIVLLDLLTLAEFASSFSQHELEDEVISFNRQIEALEKELEEQTRYQGCLISLALIQGHPTTDSDSRNYCLEFSIA